MSVNVVLRGRLGNNLFQYAIGRIIAENLGLALECRPLALLRTQVGRHIQFSGPSTLAELSHYFPNAPLSMAGDRCVSPLEIFDVQALSDWAGQTVDLGAILRNRSPRQIWLHGYFQRYEYFVERWAAIRHWFAMRPVDLPYTIGDGDVIVNVRRGEDYNVLGWILPLTYYGHAIKRVKRIKQLYVCGTGIDQSVIEYLAAYNPIYIPGTPIEHFSLIHRFKRIILANSTFGWWAAALSQASDIYAPRWRGAGYSFSGYKDVDLRIREARFHEIDVARAP